MTIMSANPTSSVPLPRAQIRPGPKLWTTQEFDDLVARGAFEESRVELIEGELLELPPMNDPHAQAVQLAQYALLAVFPPTTHTVRVQLPMRLPSGSRPLPDLVVVPGTPRQVAEHPTTALLVVEVSDTTLDFDQIDKAELYARNGIEEYWIINLINRCIEVHRQPVLGQFGHGRYDAITSLSAGASLTTLSMPNVAVQVNDLLP